MGDTEHIDWKGIFSKPARKFTEQEIYMASFLTEGPLGLYRPEFWKVYRKFASNPPKIQKIWDMEYDWYKAVEGQKFRQAKALFNKLMRVKWPRK